MDELGISRATVTAWVRSNKLSAQRVGRRLAFEPGAVASLKALREMAKEGGGKAAKPRQAIDLIRSRIF